MRKYIRKIFTRLGCVLVFFSLGMVGVWKENVLSKMSNANAEEDFIKWVDFDVTAKAMNDAYKYDLETHSEEISLNWIDLLAILGAQYGGDFKKYKTSNLEEIAEKLLTKEKTVKEYAENMKYFSYYREAYGAVLEELVGEYKIQCEENGKLVWKECYGLKAFHPIAKGFPYSHFDDFGTARSYGYKRQHLGHDLMGQVGTPIIAVESGKVTALGWNQYGGWRIGIESFDGKRYYYYAHLRQNRPYAEGLEEGDVVQAGDVIGYMGRTGYSATENVNNIDENHLHFGMQLIFDESQRDGNGEIWISCYELVNFLSQNSSQTQRNDETKEWIRVYQTEDL
ncbi:MAG: M23 family metallopeptidase [Schaedlerella sp.]|nr:M23 family metallopeptidase [Schaedlerella sp.]